MKKRINLLLSKRKSHLLTVYGEKIKLVVSVIGVICFLIFLYLTVMFFRVKSNINKMNEKKKLYLSYLLENKDTEANVRYFKGKQIQLTDFLKDDAHFLPYYTILKEALNSSTQSALLDTIMINKLRETTFVVQFSNYENMILFIKYIESDEFLSKFNQLTLANFSLNVKSSTPNAYKYQLQFQGKFNQINE